MRQITISALVITVFILAPFITRAATINEIHSQIANVWQAITQIQNQLANLKRDPIRSVQSEVSIYTNQPYQIARPSIKRNLWRGVRGDDVNQLQQYLRSTDDYKYPRITGYYGSVTEAAVRRYQCRKMNICAGSPNTNGYGVVGPLTRRNIATTHPEHTPPRSQVIYSWEIGSWGTCQNSIQNRSVQCKGSDGSSNVDTKCTATKPAKTKSCTMASIPPTSAPPNSPVNNNQGPNTTTSAVSCNLNSSTFDSLEITSGKYKNLWRHRRAGTINSYFMFSAMYHSNQFSNSERKQAVEAALTKLVVGKWAPGTQFSNGMKVSINGKVLEANIPGITGTARPAVPTGASAGTFIYDDGMVWEYLGKGYPGSWEYFLVDVSENLLTPIDVDSNDSYAAMLIAAAGKFADSGWLNSQSAHAGLTNIELLKKIADANMESGIMIPEGVYLSDTFQNQTKSNGQMYNIRFLADNAEVYTGYKALEKMFGLVGDTSRKDNAGYLAAIVKSGIVNLFDNTVGRFKTHSSQINHANLNGCSAFVTDHRFHLWPALHGMFNNNEEALYITPVYNYTLQSCPGVYEDQLDAFPLSEWFWADYKANQDQKALKTLIRRVDSVADNMPTIVDVALSLDACRVLK